MANFAWGRAAAVVGGSGRGRAARSILLQPSERDTDSRLAVELERRDLGTSRRHLHRSAAVIRGRRLFGSPVWIPPGASPVARGAARPLHQDRECFASGGPGAGLPAV